MTHFGGVNELLVEGSTVISATTGGVAFGTIGSGPVTWDSVWTCPGELSLSDVRCLSRDGAGNLWMGTNGGGIDVALAAGGFQHFGQLEGLPLDMQITCIFPDSVIWAGTTEGLCSRDLGYFNVWTEYSTGGGLPSNVVNCVAAVDSGLLVGTTDGIVLLRAGAYPGSADSWFVLPGGEDLSPAEFLVHGDTTWAATTDGLYRMVGGRPWVIDPSYPGSLPLSFAGDGRHLAVGGSEDICVFDGATWTRSTYALGGQLVQDILWISEDSLAFGQSSATADSRAAGNGVAVGVFGSWRGSLPDGVPSNDLRAVDVDPDGNVWVSSYNNGAAVRTQWGWIEFREQLPSRHQIFALRADRSGGVFLAPYHFGVTWIDWQGTPETSDDVFITWNSTNSGLLNDQVMDISISPTGEVWFAQEPYWDPGTEASGVVRLSWTPGQETTASWKTFQPSQGLPSGDVRAVLPSGSSTTAWMGTKTGLVEGDIQSGQVLFSSGSQSGLPSSDVTALALGRNGDLYAGTTGGLAILPAGEVYFSEVDGITGGVSVLGFDDLSCLWALGDDALHRVRPDGIREVYNLYNSPLQSLAVRGIACNADEGLLYLVTDHGLWELVLEQGLSGQISTATVYPNPFRPGAGEVLGIAGLPDAPLVVSVFDLTGGLVYESQSQDRDDFVWAGLDDAGNVVASGTYLVRVEQEGEAVFIKLALVR
jgi:hypothetical protein